MKIFWSFLFAGSPLFSFAQEPSCPDKVEQGGSIQVQQMPSRDHSKCYISVRNFKESGLIYRTYLFSSEGSFMVFNSFGKGPDEEDTGAREFFFFPRPVTQVSFAWNEEARRLEVSDISGSKFFFDYEDANIMGLDRATVKVSPEVVKANKGGVEISNFKGLVLDAGFTLGKAPTQVSSGSSVFTDSAGLTCRLKNSVLFKYSSDGDVKFRYSDKDLIAFLKTACPQLKPQVNL